MSDKNPKVDQFDQTLAVLQQYLGRLTAEDDQGDNAHFLIDWELLYDAIHPQRAKSVYSGVVWRALECYAADHNSLVLADGTREELERHLQDLVEQHKHNSRLLSQDKGPKVSIGPFEGREDYRVILDAVLKLRFIEKAIGGIIYLMRRFLSPLPFQREDLDEQRVQRYLSDIDFERPDTPVNNRADALNLASAEQLRSELRNARVTLISSTSHLHRVAADHLTNPLFFAFRCEFRHLYPKREHRKSTLLRMQKRVIEHRIAVSRARSVGPGTGIINRQDVRRFLTGLEKLEDDDVLCELGAMIRKAELAVENAEVQVADIISGRFRGTAPGFSATYGWISDEIQGIRHDSCNLELSSEVDDDQFGSLKLPSSDRTIAEVCVCKTNAVTVRWWTEESITRVFELLRTHVWKDEEKVQVGVRTADRAGMDVQSMPIAGSISSHLKRWGYEQKIIFLRFSAPTIEVWYDPQTTSRIPTGKKPVSKKNWRESLPRVSVRITEPKRIDDVAEFWEETSVFWVTREAFSSAIGRALGGSIEH